MNPHAPIAAPRSRRRHQPALRRLDRLHRLTPLAALAACLSFGAGGAHAAEAAAPADGTDAAKPADDPVELKGVVVRSRNRIERVQDVPLSVSVISGKELDRELAYDIGAITKRVANVVRNSGNSRTFSLSIRGVGKVTQTEAQDTSVGVIVDGVNLAYAPLASFDFFDVDSVEAARGPQGTLLGKNSTMGVIVINTRKPSFTPDANWSITLGQHNTLLSQVAAGGPVVDDLIAWRAALTVNKGAGAFENHYNPDQTYYDRDRVSGRVQLLITPSSDLSVRLGVNLQPKAGEYYNGETVHVDQPATYSNGATTIGVNSLDIRAKLARRWFADRNLFSYDKDWLNNPYVNLDNQRPLITQTRGAEAEVKWRFGNHELTSITAYREYHFHARNDEGTPFDISLNGGGKVDAYRQRSQELRVANKAGGFVDYQFGTLLFQNTVDYGQGGWISGWGHDAGAWFANAQQYNRLDADGNGRYLLSASLDGLNKGQAQYIKNVSTAVFGQADWHFTPQLTLTTGLRLTHEDRRNKGDSTIIDNGVAGVNLNAPAQGGFATDAKGNLSKDASGNDVNTAAQLALADATAAKYFNAANYAALKAPQKQQLADVKAIRAGQLGTLWTMIDGPRFRKTQPGGVISPSYKFTPDETGYLTLQYGEKGGVSQIVNGTPRLAEPEKVSSFEAGLKSVLLGKTLFVNADVFLSKLRNYQQAVTIPDPLVAGTSTVTYVGNADKVEIKGLEVDGSYSGIRDLTVRFSGAYTDARYKAFPFSPQPVENQYPGAPAYQDVSGRYLTGAARFTGNLGVEYRRELWSEKVFHASFNTAFSSGFNTGANLSSYGWVKKRWLTDASIGLGRVDGKFDVSLIAKNLFNDNTPQAVSWNSYTPAEPRWVGLQFAGRL